MTRRARRLVAELKAMLDGPNEADLARMVEDAKREVAVIVARQWLGSMRAIGIEGNGGRPLSFWQRKTVPAYLVPDDSRKMMDHAVGLMVPAPRVDWRRLEQELRDAGWRDGALRVQLAELRELDAERQKGARDR